MIRSDPLEFDGVLRLEFVILILTFGREIILLSFKVSHFSMLILIFHLTVHSQMSSVACYKYLVLRFIFTECVRIALSSTEVNVSVFVLLVGISDVYMFYNIGENSISWHTSADNFFFSDSRLPIFFLNV